MSSVSVIAEGAVTFGLVGLVVLAWASSGFFRTLDAVFAIVLEEDRRRDAAARGVIGILGVVVVATLLGLVVGLTMIASSVLGDWLGGLLPAGAVRSLQPLLTAGIMIAAVTAGYRYLPTDRPSWRAIGVPAVAVGISFAVLTEAFTLIAPFLAGYASLYGAIAAIFVLLSWLQLSAQLVVLGVIWVRIRARGMPAPATVPWPAGEIRRPGATTEG